MMRRPGSSLLPSFMVHGFAMPLVSGMLTFSIRYLTESSVYVTAGSAPAVNETVLSGGAMQIRIGVKSDLYLLAEIDQSQKSGHVVEVVYISPIPLCTTMNDANQLAADLGGGIAVRHEKR
jgi:hypothetical protein